MEALLSDLRTLLARQVENLKTLEEILGRQRECLIDRDVPGIIDSISEQEDYLKRIRKMEENRFRLMHDMAKVLGLEPGGITIRELSENLDPEIGEEIRATAEAARGTLEKIGRVNRENRRLIERSLDFVHEMLGAIVGKRTGGRTYEETGGLKPREQERMLVDRTT